MHPRGPSSRDGFLGVVMLDTRFVRPVGDIGNPATFARHGIETRFEVVHGAKPEHIVGELSPAWCTPFVEAAQRLEAAGASLISTSCGFLAPFQEVLAKSVKVPVVSSSLLQVNSVPSPGIVTFDAHALGPALLQALGIYPQTPVRGLKPGCELMSCIQEDKPALDIEAAQNDVVQAALALVEAFPEVQTIVLECTNMPPYRHAVAQATGRAVVDIETLLLEHWLKLQG